MFVLSNLSQCLSELCMCFMITFQSHAHHFSLRICVYIDLSFNCFRLSEFE